jgi:mRNA interferase RelE/StbE
VQRDWRVRLTNQARRQLHKLPDRVQDDVLEILDQMSEDPFPPGSIQLRGWNDRHRIRVNGYRMVYRVNRMRRTVLVTRVLHRPVAYEGLER